MVLTLVRSSHEVRQQRRSWHMLEVVVFKYTETHFRFRNAGSVAQAGNNSRSLVQCSTLYKHTDILRHATGVLTLS